MTTKKVCSIALPTFTAQVDVPTTDRSLASVSGLLDTAAQTSLVSREVVDRLQLKPYRQEFTTLVGFNMSKPVAKAYDVVRIPLIKPGFSQKVSISCLVIDKTPATSSMIGLCQLAKKLQQKGANISDARLLNQKQDRLSCDILVGADYFMSLVSSKAPTTRLVGNYLLNTVFGQAIIGKIKGSTKLSNDKSVNQLTVNSVATVCNEMNNEFIHTVGCEKNNEFIHPGLLIGRNSFLFEQNNVNEFSDLNLCNGKQLNSYIRNIESDDLTQFPTENYLKGHLKHHFPVLSAQSGPDGDPPQIGYQPIERLSAINRLAKSPKSSFQANSTNCFVHKQELVMPTLYNFLDLFLDDKGINF